MFLYSVMYNDEMKFLRVRRGCKLFSLHYQVAQPGPVLIDQFYWAQ